MITVYYMVNADLYREALGRIISSVAKLRVLGQSACALQGIDQVRLMHPDIVIVDNDLPDMNVFEVVKAIRRSAIPCIVIMITDQANPSIRESAIAAGVDYFLDKFFESQKIGPILETLVRLLSGSEEEVPN